MPPPLLPATIPNASKTSLELALVQLEKSGSLVDYAGYAALLKQCGDARCLEDGKRVHAHIMENGHGNNRFLANHVIHMYGRCGSPEDARTVFDRLPFPNPHSWNIMITAYSQNGRIQEASCVFDRMPGFDVVTWNGMITAYAQNGHPRLGMELYLRMHQEGYRPNNVSFLSVLDACSRTGDWEQGRILHYTILVETGYVARDIMVATALLGMHGKCGRPDYAKGVFDMMGRHNEISLTAMVSVYTLNGHMEEASEIFQRLPDWNVFAATAMVQGYAQRGDLHTAREMFERMPERNLITWNALMTGYAQNGHQREAIQLFRLMDVEGAQPCTVSSVICLDACAASGAAKVGRVVHSSILGTGMESDVAVSNSLVYFYVKCGSVEEGMEVFGNMRERNVVSWSGVINAFAQEGHVDEALRVFYTMQVEGVEADEITFMIILAACSHGGVLEDGLSCFNSLILDYRIRPERDHYLCMIDLLARTGQLKEAEELVKTMPFEADGVAWRILLNSSDMHGKSQNGVTAGGNLLGLSSVEKRSSSFVLLSNLYKKQR